ncbi:MAG: DNA mismatch repair endonuclease MutL [Bacteriovoracaceae bacterium]|nr:DNA mismatch repair endonuclease MutL [Bacteriovoracaceae bacterium]
MVHSPPKIDILPEHLIDQIKAGEVIERPGNLIKEILENAVDAGAKKLELTIKNNGLDLISLKDDGHGMRFQDLPLAFSRHATSKISRFEDLYKLHSFGFRGEALASIASISKLQCISKTQDHAASEIRIEGGMTVFHGERQTHTSSHGTELVIQDLFFNTPARLKFIQSQQSEKTFIRKIIFAFILSRPEIEFHIKLDDADKDIYPARETHLDRIKDLFPKAKDAIFHSQRFYENNELDLFLIPGSFKAPLKLQNIFINNRYILDKQLHRVMTNGIDSTFPGDDFHYVAYFNLPPDTIDVNVHPNKTIIKCLEISKMISLLTSTIKELGSKRPVTTHHQEIQPGPSFFDGLTSIPTLQQERHEYNMEGLFSPHNLPETSSSDLIWIGNSFLKKNENLWLAVSSPKLLELFTKAKLQTPAPTIPLLVSEPFAAKDIKKETLLELEKSGVEIEFLGSETLVLRGIPEWMNGFPLKDVIQCLILNKSFSEMPINPADWSQTTWEDMLAFFPTHELISKKVVLDLAVLLREKLK